MKTAFIFSGQGAQYAGMGKDLYENFECVKEIFDKADSVLDFKVKCVLERTKDLTKQSLLSLLF